MGKTALVVGATGLVGGELVKILLAAPEYDRVLVWVRRSIGMTGDKLEERIIDFDRLGACTAAGKVDHVFCCLGTTIKKAKTREAFIKVDLEYPLALGGWARANGVAQFLVISALGADANSRIFYSRTKGQMEQALGKLGLNGLHIFRPSLLLGERNEFRLGEAAAAKVSRLVPFLFSGPLKQYAPVQAGREAGAMYKVALQEKRGIHTYSSNEIDKITGEPPG